MGWNFLPIPKAFRLRPNFYDSCWILGIDKKLHPTPHRLCDYSSMLGLNFTCVSKRGPWHWGIVYNNTMVPVSSSPSSSLLLNRPKFYFMWPGGRPCHCSIDYNLQAGTCDRFHGPVHERWDQRYVKETNNDCTRRCLCVFEPAFQWDLDMCDFCLYQRQRCVVSCEPVCCFWMVHRRWCRWAKNRQ